MSLSVKAEEIKKASNIQLYQYFNNAKSNPEILFILKNIGKLQPDFVGSVFEQYLENEYDEIRYWAVKNIGKLGDKRFADTLYRIAQTDNDSMVRREAVSSLGRMRNENLIPYFSELLGDNDPKVVMQAMRALLVFKQKSEVIQALKSLKDHPNEQIQTVLKTEFAESVELTDYGVHTDIPEYMINTVVLGDVKEVMQLVPDGSIHLTFTSPPYYNARDYSIYDSYSAYLDFLTAVFKEVHRITKEGRFLIVNTSPIIIPRISRSYSSKRYPIPFDLHARLVDLGWEFIDDIVWAKPETSVKNRNAGFYQHRKPLAYKPNPTTEYLMVYRKETTKLIDWNINQYEDAVVEDSKVLGEYETSNLWHIPPKADKTHTAIFPEELCERVISYYSFQGDLVFDPFGGSGTLGLVARSLKRYFFLTEISDEYFARIQERLQRTIFQDKPNHFTNLDQFKDDVAKAKDNDETD